MEPTGFLATAEAVSTILLTLAVLGVLVVLFLLLLQARRVTRSLRSLLKHMETEAGPVMDRARSVAENVEFITMSVRTDIQKVTGSVEKLNERLTQASDHMEQRIQDFNALVEVLQEEAENVALDTAAAVRGMRAGSRKLAGSEETPFLDEGEARPREALSPGSPAGNEKERGRSGEAEEG